MCCSIACILRWFIYLFSFACCVLSIAVIVVDERNRTNTSGSLGTNIGVMVLMFVSGFFGLLHYWSPRLIMILVMVILCVAFMIVRAIFIPTDYQFDLVWVALADAIFGSLYFYWVAFRIDSGTNAQTKWDVLTSSSSTSSPNSSSNASDIDYIFIKRRPR